jgi:Rrf2 family iron-sulfur cluster assembly transcriptional regulator
MLKIAHQLIKKWQKKQAKFLLEASSTKRLFCAGPVHYPMPLFIYRGCPFLRTLHNQKPFSCIFLPGRRSPSRWEQTWPGRLWGRIDVSGYSSDFFLRTTSAQEKECYNCINSDLNYRKLGRGVFMEISKATVAAIHGLVYLANSGDDAPVDVSEISQNLGIPPGYLAKIFQRLSRRHLVFSRRGPQGGYVLGAEPGKISFMDVIEALDGPITTGRCELGPGDHCRFFYRCKIRKELDNLKNQTRKLYKNITLDMFEKQFKES